MPALTLDAVFALLGSRLRLLVSPADLRDIALENLALRQQLAVFKRKCPRPRLLRTDRFLWVWRSRSWKDWHRTLVNVRPETVVAWHRQGFRLFWNWISSRKCGRMTSRTKDRGPERRAKTAVFWWLLWQRMHHYRVLAKDREQRKEQLIYAAWVTKASAQVFKPN